MEQAALKVPFMDDFLKSNASRFPNPTMAIIAAASPGFYWL